jgi:hypothetical protein
VDGHHNFGATRCKPVRAREHAALLSGSGDLRVSAAGAGAPRRTAMFVCEPASITVTGLGHEEGPPFLHGLAPVVTEIEGSEPLRLVSGHLNPSSRRCEWWRQPSSSTGSTSPPTQPCGRPAERTHEVTTPKPGRPSSASQHHGKESWPAPELVPPLPRRHPVSVRRAWQPPHTLETLARVAWALRRLPAAPEPSTSWHDWECQ